MSRCKLLTDAREDLRLIREYYLAEGSPTAARTVEIVRVLHGRRNLPQILS